MRRHEGFTLIEVMVTVAIVAILAAIAIPSYAEYVTRSRITEATSTLSAVRVRMEQLFQDERTYARACTANTIVPPIPATTTFAYACENLDVATYRVRATGQGTMANFVYTIDQANVRTTVTLPAGWTVTPNCWVLKRDGSC